MLQKIECNYPKVNIEAKKLWKPAEQVSIIDTNFELESLCLIDAIERALVGNMTTLNENEFLGLPDRISCVMTDGLTLVYDYDKVVNDYEGTIAKVIRNIGTNVRVYSLFEGIESSNQLEFSCFIYNKNIDFKVYRRVEVLLCEIFEDITIQVENDNIEFYANNSYRKIKNSYLDFCYTILFECLTAKGRTMLILDNKSKCIELTYFKRLLNILRGIKNVEQIFLVE